MSYLSGVENTVLVPLKVFNLKRSTIELKKVTGDYNIAVLELVASHHHKTES